MSKPAIKKSARFRNLLPIIESKLDEGYSYDGVIEILKSEHELELTLGVFRNYLSKFRKNIADDNTKQPINIDKQISTNESQYQQNVGIQNLPTDNEVSTNDDEIDPAVLKTIEAELERKKNSFASKSIFDK